MARQDREMPGRARPYLWSGARPRPGPAQGAGGWVAEHHAGESWAVGADVTHWEENAGSEPLVLSRLACPRGLTKRRQAADFRVTSPGVSGHDVERRRGPAHPPCRARAEADHTRA